MADSWSGFEDGYREQLKRYFERRSDLLQGVDYKRAKELGAQGAAASVAPLLWAEAVGERWDTTATAEFLGISRQALHERVKRGTVLGLPGRGTTWFPTWQFDLLARTVRPVVLDIVEAFREELGDLDAYTVAAWATSRQPGLAGLTPADWLGSGHDERKAVQAASRTARKLAS
jgi:hypothetical protein